MFKTIREKVDLIEGVEKYTGLAVIEAGSETFELEDKACPFCHHKDCFKIKSNEETQFWSCFSECGEEGQDLTTFVSKMYKEGPKEAAERIAGDFNIALPKSNVKVDPMAELFNTAAAYYYRCLMEVCIKKEPVLGGMTPLEYQMNHRGHELKTLVEMQVGWSDGELIPYLRSLGYDEELLKKSGLLSESGKRDKFPAKTFIYPHRVKGQVSRFTIKNPDKEATVFQMRTKDWINDPQWYNQDSVRSRTDVIIAVEGENDLLSILDSEWSEAVVASIGSVGKKQATWLAQQGKGKHLITIFDTDGGGDKARKFISNHLHAYASVTHVAVPEDVNDVDNALQNGMSLEDLIKNYKITVPVKGKTKALNLVREAGVDLLPDDVENEEGYEANDSEAEVTEDAVDSDSAGDNPIFESKGCYWKVRYIDGVEKLVAVTNFTIRLLNVFERNGERSRQVVIQTKSGRRSDPIQVNSADKVSLKPFKTLIANAADASFYGSESDLTKIWEYVYDNAKPGYVWISDTVGVVRRHKGWLFEDCYIDQNGVLHEPDDEGIMWIGGNEKGIKARSLNSEDMSSEGMDVPRLDIYTDPDERSDLLEGLVKMLSQNLGSPGMALTMLGWTWANAYSNEIFKLRKFFPFLYMWGRHGKGKTNLVKWLLAVYNMEECGYTTIGNLKSAVGFERKAAFYDSLPMAVDELRADRNTAQYYGKFRGWYNRAARTMGTKEGLDVKVVPVRSNFMFCGQDVFTDSAAAERCITLQIPTNGRELSESYKWIDDRSADLSAIGYGWILEAVQRGPEHVFEGIGQIDDLLKDTCPSARTRFQWGIAGYFGMRLRDMYMPTFNYEQYLKDACSAEATEIEENDVLLNFLEYVEGLCAGERPHITSDYVGINENKISLWFGEIFNIVQRHRRSSSEGLEPFSKKALLAGFRDEPWFLPKPDRVCLGMSGTQRRVLTFDLATGPEVLKRIGDSVTSSCTS